MAANDLAALITRARQDRELMEKLSQSANMSEFLKVASDAGFSFDTHEIKDDLQKLSDCDLEFVAGGHAAPYAGCAIRQSGNLSKDEWTCPGDACLFTWRP